MHVPTVALVGVGGYGRDHYRYLKQLHQDGKLRFSAAVIRARSMGKYTECMEEMRKLGVEIFPSDEALISAGQTDLAVLPVGIEAHCALSCKYLAAGVNVLLEKPAAGSLADVNRMIAAENNSTAFLAVGFQNMYGYDIHAIKRIILSQRYGKLRNISVRGAWMRGDTYYQRNNWAGKLRAEDGTAILDSPINNAFAHFLNIALFCAGESFSATGHAVAMQGELVRARPAIETFDTCGIRILTQDEISIQVLLTHSCGRNLEPEIKLELEQGTIFWDRTGWRLRDDSGQCLRREVNSDCKITMYELLIQRLAGENAPIYTLENAREHTFCIENLHKHFAIHGLEPEEYSIHADLDNQYVIPGIESLFEDAYSQNLLPSEAGASWSRASEMKKL